MMTQLIFLIAFIYAAEKRKFNSNVECRYKLAHKWECLTQTTTEIFIVVPKPWMQTVSIAVELKYHAW